MLINLSNHPSSQWPKKQLQAGKYFGDIIDLEFPVVDPAGDTAYIQLLAVECVENVKSILSHLSDPKSPVHVMGEPTLVYHIVQLLKLADIKCLASTTTRQSEEKDGIKTSKFLFCQFREY